MTNIQHIIFDLDDTLLLCAKYFEKSKGEFVALMQKSLGVSREEVLTTLHNIDNQLFPKLHFHYMRFSLALLDTYETLCLRYNKEHQQAVQMKVLEIGMTLQNNIPKDVAHAKTVVTSLKDAGYQLYILTAGSPNVQMHKINNTWVKDVFDLDNIFINEQKSCVEMTRVIQTIMSRYPGTSLDNIIMVGDNLVTDITSAHKAGIKGIHIRHQDKNTYEKQLKYPRRCNQIDTIAALPSILRV